MSLNYYFIVFLINGDEIIIKNVAFKIFYLLLKKRLVFMIFELKNLCSEYILCVLTNIISWF